MRIALFITVTPFVTGGSEFLVNDLTVQLRKRGHIAKLFRIPFSEEFEVGIFTNALCVQMLNFDDYDILISFKYPAYLAVHKKKNLWLFHQLRQAYDLFGKEYGLQDNNLGNAIKQIVCQTDNISLPQANKIFALSESVKRLKKFNNIEAEVMECPLINSGKYYKNKIGDYIYYPSRVDYMKRQLLAIEAMHYVKSAARLVIDGKIDDGGLANKIKHIISKYNLNNVTVSGEFVSEEYKIKRYADCLCAVYLPKNEDSCGFVTMESFYSHKPVITVSDSGGVTDFVKDGENGYVTEPNPKAIAAKIDRLYEHKEEAEKMGENAYQFIFKRNINWDDTIRRLLV
jgi:glycosyltransferase involved in cell wall biosynthesis